jgi:hypothetical protein
MYRDKETNVGIQQKLEVGNITELISLLNVGRNGKSLKIDGTETGDPTGMKLQIGVDTKQTVEIAS